MRFLKYTSINYYVIFILSMLCYRMLAIQGIGAQGHFLFSFLDGSLFCMRIYHSILCRNNTLNAHSYNV